MTKDLTKGTPWKLILFFTIPIFAGNIFQQLYNMADTIIVGRYVSVDALAAVGATGAVVFLVLGFAVGMTSGFGIIVAQRFGAEDYEGVRNSVGTSIILSLIISLVITVVSLATSRWLLNIMNTPENIFEDSLLYLNIIYAGTAATIYYNLIAAILRALGDSKTPLYFLLFSSVLNIVLDLVFIINFNMGIAGAAVATVISQLVSAILCTFYTAKRYKILSLKRENFKINRILIMTHLRMGLPMALQFSITAMGVMFVQAALNVFGSNVIAAYTAANKVEALVTQTYNALGISMATYCGQNLGANKIGRIKQGMRTATLMTALASVAAICINVFLGGALTGLFMSDINTDILAYSKQYLNIVAGFYPLLGILLVYRNSLQGLGDSLFPMLGGVAELVSRVAVLLFLPGLLGYVGVCLASPFAWLVTASLLVVRYMVWVRKKMKPALETPV